MSRNHLLCAPEACCWLTSAKYHTPPSEVALAGIEVILRRVCSRELVASSSTENTMVKLLAVLWLVASVALGLDLRGRDWTLHSVPATNEKSSLTLLYQNNLNSTDDESHVGVILLGALAQHDIGEACEEIGESMVSFATIERHVEEFMSYFSYLVFSGGAEPSQRYYTREGVLSVGQGFDELSLWQFGGEDSKLPVLCTRTSTEHTRYHHGRFSRDTVRVASGGNTYVGLRDRKSFRFLGIPYADPPQRFTYSELYSKRSQTIHATEYGPSCAQAGRGSEDCLFLNIQTPHIPKKGSTNGLKPVLFWIHGGGLLEGSGSDPLTDGGNLASREDIVVVSFNYRLSTLGFLTVPGSDIRGNYGIADQIVALEVCLYPRECVDIVLIHGLSGLWQISPSSVVIRSISRLSGNLQTRDLPGCYWNRLLL